MGLGRKVLHHVSHGLEPEGKVKRVEVWPIGRPVGSDLLEMFLNLELNKARTSLRGAWNARTCAPEHELNIHHQTTLCGDAGDVCLFN